MKLSGLRSATKSTSEALSYLQNVNPGVHKLLTNTKVTKTSKKGEVKVNLFQHIESYRAYKEKMILCDPMTAEVIVEKILENSNADQNTPFVDADGALCLVGKQILDKTSKPVLIMNRDRHFDSTIKKCIEPYKDRVKVENFNLGMWIGISECDPPRSSSNSERFNALVGGFMPKSEDSKSGPSYSLYANCPHYLCKFLALDYLASLDRKIYQDTLFKNHLPEFFLTMSDRTYQHVSSGHEDLKLGEAHNTVFRNRLSVLANIVFDIKWLHTFSSNAFIPWKTTKNRLYDHSISHLVKVTPKVGLFATIRDSLDWNEFVFFVQIMCSGKTNKVIWELEKLVPGIGKDLIMKMGMSVTTENRQVPVGAFARIFEILVSQENYTISAFKANAEMQSQDDLILKERDNHNKNQV